MQKPNILRTKIYKVRNTIN